MESARIVSWRYKFIDRIRKLRSEGCRIIYLDETWFDTHDVVKKGWDDGTCNCVLKAPTSRGKRIMVLHAGGSEGWVDNCLYLSAKNIGDSKADSHDEMTATVFENWFKNRLLANLPRDRKCIIILDNASYHSRQKIKIPTMNTNVKDIVNFMKQNNITVPNPLPIKAVLLQEIKSANIGKKYAVEELADSYGHEVLRLPPYHCVLNPIELIWAQLKSYVRKNNVTPTLSASVCQLLRDGAAIIGPDAWSSCVQHAIKKENSYMTHDTDGTQERFVIHLGENDDTDE